MKRLIPLLAVFALAGCNEHSTQVDANHALLIDRDGKVDARQEVDACKHEHMVLVRTVDVDDNEAVLVTCAPSPPARPLKRP